MKEMHAMKITPIHGKDNEIILFLNEENTITDIELMHIQGQYEAGVTEGETFDVQHAAGGIWQLVQE